MEQLDQQLTALMLEKFDITNEEAEKQIEELLLAGIRIERARVAFLATNPDSDFLEVATGLIDLADLFDDVQLGIDERQRLQAAVSKILKVTDPAKLSVASEVFLSVLNGGTVAANTDKLINDLLSKIPTENA